MGSQHPWHLSKNWLSARWTTRFLTFSRLNPLGWINISIIFHFNVLLDDLRCCSWLNMLKMYTIRYIMYSVVYSILYFTKTVIRLENMTLFHCLLHLGWMRYDIQSGINRKLRVWCYIWEQFCLSGIFTTLGWIAKSV